MKKKNIDKEKCDFYKQMITLIVGAEGLAKIEQQWEKQNRTLEKPEEKLNVNDCLSYATLGLL